MKKIGIVGCGAIGEGLALFINKNLSGQATLTTLADKRKTAATSLNKKLPKKAKIKTIKNLVKEVDLVIETASQAAACQVIKQTLNYKKDVIILSVGALIKNLEILKKTQAKNINLYIPSGAISGVDGLAALAKGNIKKLTITTSKPPAGLAGANYLKNKKINIKKIDKPTIIFSGDVAEATKYFPKNINVAATLLLASKFDKVKVVIKLNPKIKRNIHKIEAMADEAKIKIEVENVSSKINPKTSALTILSTQTLLEKIFSPVKIGT
ncbi:MAG: aspartate dehydrogenase domain-containing protein [Candidatus Omnitrophota bacterium]